MQNPVGELTDATPVSCFINHSVRVTLGGDGAAAARTLKDNPFSLPPRPCFIPLYPRFRDVDTLLYTYRANDNSFKRMSMVIL